MFGLNPYLAGGALLILVGSLSFAGCEHLRAKSARAGEAKAVAQRDEARAANASNIVTIDTQAKALEQWKALHKTPEEVSAIVSNARAYVDEIDRLSRQVKFYRERDKSLPECLRLMQIAYSTCPGRTAVLHNFSNGSHQDR